MLLFKPVMIGDKDIIQSFSGKSIFRNCDFSFSNMFGWSHYYNTTFTVSEENFLCVRFQPRNDSPGYLFPLGDGNLEEAVNALITDAESRNNPFYMYGVTQTMFELIEKIMPGKFVYEKNRNWFEYIYSSDDLIRLTGKKFQSKRNHINKFKRTYEWEYLPITHDIIPDCLTLYKRWCRENGGCNTEESLIEEGIATQSIFDNYEHLNLIGGALRINGEILAYSYGQALTEDTFGIHAEKCLPEIDGGFSMMNQQFAEHNCSEFLYINREEDLGLESLRKAKLSYHPTILLEKGYLRLK
ncbi:MAG: phosphatidylglycerol lysyltransferase domain-containing protein [Dysgonamonadaceae bacterium]|jgi:hypothetical protein|nr:phosphatidylglycerol lysyltransferase domain-containing protein [Dysgonamonadaceae bacterium]